MVDDFTSRINGITVPVDYASSSRSTSFVKGAASWVGRPASTTTNTPAPLDLTGTVGTITMISPRHYIGANHLGTDIGWQTTFRDAQGNTYTRTAVGAIGNIGHDIVVGVFDSDLPSSIAYYPVFDYGRATSTLTTLKVPVVVRNQFSEYLIRRATLSSTLLSYTDFPPDSIFYPYSLEYNPTTDTMEARAHVGDSGSPLFYIFNGQLVLAAEQYTTLIGTNAGSYLSQIDAAMTQLNRQFGDIGNGYQTTRIDTSCFTSYTFNPPTFTSQHLYIDEGSANGTEVGTVAMDLHGTATSSVGLQYSIINGNINNMFAIGTTTGVITVNNSDRLLHHLHSSYTLSIRATSTVQEITDWITGSLQISVNDIPSVERSIQSVSSSAGTFASTTMGGDYAASRGQQNLAFSSNGSIIAGIDDTSLRLRISQDGGLTWTSHLLPESFYSSTPVIAMPDNGNTLFTGYKSDLYSSVDHGETWTLSSLGSLSLLREWASIDTSTSGDVIAALIHDIFGIEHLHVSTNGGTTWAERTPPTAATSTLLSVNYLDSNHTLYVVDQSRFIHTSSDYGVTWSTIDTGIVGGVLSFTISNDATHIAVTSNSSDNAVYVSRDYGATWTNRTPDVDWDTWRFEGISYSADGSKLVMTDISAQSSQVENGGEIYVSSDDGVTWSVLNYPSGTVSSDTSATWSSPLYLGSGAKIYVFLDKTQSDVMYTYTWATPVVTPSGGGGGGGGGSSSGGGSGSRTIVAVPTLATTTKTTLIPTLTPTPTFNIGATGKEVTAFQNLLVSKGYLNAKYVTGYYGPITQKAAAAYANSTTGFKRTLSLGNTGADVKALQVALNKLGFTVSKSGPGSPGNETTMYGPNTARAVSLFQQAYSAAVLTPTGLKYPTGTFGPASMKQMLLILQK
jgi:peptidoglycan hydrolase-like protein with peptidoglycan-binding domain